MTAHRPFPSSYRPDAWWWPWLLIPTAAVVGGFIYAVSQFQ